MKTGSETREKTLDGLSWKAVKAADNATIGNAADSLDALAIIAGEWLESKQELEKAEAEAAAIGKGGVAAIKAVADRLRGEATKRRSDEEAHNERVFAKAAEVAALHPALNGIHAALIPYATGEVGIAEPLTYTIGWPRKYEPEVTDANRAALAAFKPLRRNPPDTSALRVPAGAEAATLSRMAKARTRYETACRALLDALKVCDDFGAALAAEAAAEAATVEKAVAMQKERDAKTI